MKTELTKIGDTKSKIGDRTIHFKAENAEVQPKAGQTNAQGLATAVFTCHKDGAAKLIAEFHGARVEVEASLVWLGPGEVSKIGVLKGVPHGEAPTFFTPIG